MDDRSASVIDIKHWDSTRYMEEPTGWLLVEVVAMLNDAQACFQSPWKRRRLLVPDWILGQRKMRQQINRHGSSLDQC